MTQLNSRISFSALAFVGALLAAPLLAGGAQADTTAELLQCKFGSREKVVSCCLSVLNERKRPQWMDTGGQQGCNQATVCIGGGKSRARAATVAYVPRKPKCFIRINRDRDSSRNGDPQRPERPERTEQPRDAQD